MKKLWLATLLLLLIGFTASQSTGTRPGFQNIGTVPAGQTQIVNFYLTSSGYDSPYPVSVSAEEPLSSRMLDPVESPVEVEEYSEEPIDSWMDFTQDQFTVDPNNATTYVLPNGDTIEAEGRIRMYLRVPSNAEPGWHAGAISISPQIDSSGTGFGSQVQAVTQPTFVFRVPGNAERRLEVVDARGIRTGEDTARIDIRVANRGSVTTSIAGGEIDVYNRETRERVDSMILGNMEFRPQRSRVISTTMRSGVEQGSFRLNGSIDYWSSEAFIGGQTFGLSSQIQTEPADPEEFGEDGAQNNGSNTPIWLPILFVILVAVVLYSFDFDLFWIAVIAGFLAIALFIIMSPVSNWLLVILLTAPVVTFIYA
jgi:hypothetical protein